jgi:hypothetical protein
MVHATKARALNLFLVEHQEALLELYSELL